MRSGRLSRPKPKPLSFTEAVVDAGEIGRRLGKATSTIHKWRLRYPDFPDPDTVLDIGPVWYWPTVEEWYSDRNSERYDDRQEDAE